MMKSVLFLAILTFALTSCKYFGESGKKGKPIARVYEKYLYTSDMQGLVPSGTSSKDSIDITKSYINNWIKQELLLHQAESNLSDEQMNFEKQVQQYRNSLVIFQYESELIRQKLDTTLSMKEIEDYYNQNQANFLLHENILRASYVSVSRNTPLAPKFRQLIKSDKPADVEKLTELCQQHAAVFQLDEQGWISFAELAGKVPVKVTDQLEFLGKNPYFETEDSTFRYFVRVKEYKVKESISPLSFEIANIRAILLNKRKSGLISGMEEDLYKAALGKKNFEIYSY
ncbi:MAG: hypothetical protein IPH88_03145 [Bacteroidales bacterium]|nr:hypothetical protein [Bacteroidales bacterium]